MGHRIGKLVRVFNDTNQNIFTDRRVSQWGFVWGQFVDHTIGLREEASAEKADVAFNPADPLGDMTNNGPHLLLPGGYLPRRDSRGGPGTAPAMAVDGMLFGRPGHAAVAGDQRANENIALTAVQTLFAREHNRIVDLLPASLSAEQRFQIARRVVIAEQQYITYEQFLPALGVTLPRYRGYRSDVDATLSNELAVPLNVAYFNPDLVPALQLGPLLQGIGSERSTATTSRSTTSCAASCSRSRSRATRSASTGRPSRSASAGLWTSARSTWNAAATTASRATTSCAARTGCRPAARSAPSPARRRRAGRATRT
ncbi:peroxidase family protein [Dactylosporangium cerinum]|uniref:Peroxidase family protein n=1 Tax=Dactylosporangium cerinum TaxID=1434730 RepID=A0ABV9VWR0_9ACTN